MFATEPILIVPLVPRLLFAPVLPIDATLTAPLPIAVTPV